MARIVKPLTDTQVKKAKPQDKEYNLADGDGLYLRVKPNGSKLWLFNYSRPYSRKRANISLGRYPNLTLKKAREARQENLALLAEQIDPSSHRQEQSAKARLELNNTLKHVADEWFEVKKTKVSADYAKDISRSLELHLYPRLGAKPIHTIRAIETIDILKPIAAKGSLETVKRLCQRVNEIMVHAMHTGLIDTNPLANINKAFEAPKKQSMPSLSPDELPELLSAINTASIKRITRSLIEWQLHTMTRPSEAAGTRWCEINFDKQQWEIPKERMKKRRPHIIPLAPQALDLLEHMKPISGHREYVFPADREPRTHINSQTANMALKRMGFGGRLVAHGLRALASTVLNEQGFDPDVIEAGLAHVDQNSTRAAYNRAEYLERRRAMMQWWSDYIEQAANGSSSLSRSTRQLSIVNK